MKGLLVLLHASLNVYLKKIHWPTFLPRFFDGGLCKCRWGNFPLYHINVKSILHSLWPWPKDRPSDPLLLHIVHTRLPHIDDCTLSHSCPDRPSEKFVLTWPPSTLAEREEKGIRWRWGSRISFSEGTTSSFLSRLKASSFPCHILSLVFACCKKEKRHIPSLSLHSMNHDALSCAMNERRGRPVVPSDKPSLTGLVQWDKKRN